MNAQDYDDIDQIEQEAEYSGPQEEDYTISGARGGGYSVGTAGDSGRWIGDVKTRDEAEDIIRGHAGQNWRPSVWVISDHGNTHLVEDFNWHS